ncbi:unnamed protein product [Musa acuminata subsp. burmannicoides]
MLGSLHATHNRANHPMNWSICVAYREPGITHFTCALPLHGRNKPKPILTHSMGVKECKGHFSSHYNHQAVTTKLFPMEKWIDNMI